MERVQVVNRTVAARKGSVDKCRANSLAGTWHDIITTVLNVEIKEVGNALLMELEDTLIDVVILVEVIGELAGKPFQTGLPVKIVKMSGL